MKITQLASLRITTIEVLWATAVLASLDSISFAATRTWDNGYNPVPPHTPGDGITWNDKLNWDPDLVPTGVDTAQVFSGSPIVNSANAIFSLENAVMISVRSSLVVGAGSAHNAGTILVSNGSSAGNPSFGVAAGTLDGTGEVILGESNFGTSVATLSGAILGAPSPTTHVAGHTIRGEGTISGRWLNESLIRAEETSGDMNAVLQFGGGDITNSGIIRSSPTAAILVNGLNYTGIAAGQFLADTQDVLIADGTFNAGALTAINGAQYKLFSTGPTPQVVLNGATLNAPLDFPESGGGSLLSASGFINNSTITLDNHANPALAQINFLAPGTIGGAGEIVLLREGTNTVIRGFTAITNGASHTIRGVGTIGPQYFINEGTVLAEPHAGTILTLSSQTTNNALMQANSGAILLIRNAGTTQDNETGRIRAANGGFVVIDATTVTGGKLQTDGTGAIEISAAAATLQDVTNEGTLNVRAGRLLNISPGTFTNNGVLTVNSDNISVNTTLEFDGDATLQGNGVVVLNRPPTSSQGGSLRTTGDGVVVTQSAGHTIQGNGAIGTTLNRVDFVNNGRIKGNSAAQPIDVFGELYGDGTLENVRVNYMHFPGGIGTTADVPLEESYRLNGGSVRLFMDLGGLIPGTQHDQLSSTGTVNIDGVLDVNFVNLDGSYVASAGDRFTIITSTSPIVGTFDVANLPANGGHRALTWAPVDYSNPNEVVLEIAAVDFYDADFDEDGDVDNNDLIIWQAGYGTGTLHSQGNADGDGDVDGRDFMIWQRSFGWGVAPLLAATAVPEPNGLVLLLGVVFIRRR